jgi:hypothetical protein
LNSGGVTTKGLDIGEGWVNILADLLDESSS